MTWVQTISGRAVDLRNPDPATITVRDIAYSLARLARYNGHTQGAHGYSVAEHCVLLHDWFMAREDYDNARIALVHDAAEAYTGDLVFPMAAVLGPAWKAATAPIEAAVSDALRTPLCSPAVKEADRRILLDERQHLMLRPPQSWGAVENLQPLHVVPTGLDPNTAQAAWITRWMMHAR